MSSILSRPSPQVDVTVLDFDQSDQLGADDKEPRRPRSPGFRTP